MVETGGITAIKNDPHVSYLPIDIDQRQCLRLIYEVDQLADVPQILRIKGELIEIDFPVEDVEMLEYYKYIESQFAEHNETSSIDNVRIDKGILQLAEMYLDKENLDLPDNSKDAARVYALILKRVRLIDSDRDLLNYLQENPKTTQLSHLSTHCGNISPSTFTNIRKKFDIDRQSIQNLILRIQHTLYRNGILLDKLDQQEWCLYQAIPKWSGLSDSIRNQALVNWGELLLQQATDGIPKYRANNKKYTMREIIALVAKLVLDCKRTKGENLARLQFQDDIITRSQLNTIIRTSIGQNDFFTGKNEIEALSTELHRNLWRFAKEESGFFTSPINVAYDPTWIPVDEGVDADNIPGALNNPQIENNGGFCFATGTTFSPMSRFSLGVNLITDKSKIPVTFRNHLANLTDFADLDWITADREFDNPETIELCRSVPNANWIIRLRSNKNLIDTEEKLKLKNNGKAILSYGGIDVNGFYSYLEESNKKLHFKDDDELILLSDQPLEGTTILDLAPIYNKRWSAETHIRQLKHDFTPEVNNDNALQHLFYLNMGSMFYNMYKIINQSLSPVYGFPLRPNHYEVLFGLIYSTFSPFNSTPDL